MVKELMNLRDYFKLVFHSEYGNAPLYEFDVFVNVNTKNEFFIDYIIRNTEFFFILFKTKATHKKIDESKQLVDIINECW